MKKHLVIAVAVSLLLDAGFSVYFHRAISAMAEASNASASLPNYLTAVFAIGFFIVLFSQLRKPPIAN